MHLRHALKLPNALVLCAAVSLAGCGGGGGGGNSAPPPPPNNPVPSITSLQPPSVAAGALAQTLEINGSNFLADSAVTVNGANHTSAFVSSSQMTVALTASDQAVAGVFPVVVSNPSPGGGASSPASFTVSNPTPGISGLSPAEVIAGAAPQTLTVSGSGFDAASTVSFNGIAQAATLTKPGELTIALTAAEQATAGKYPLVVANPAPGGGNSAPADFTVLASNGTDLSITVAGLPGSAMANAELAGPGGFNQRVTATTVLTGLAAGAYSISAGVVSTGASNAPVYFWPTLGGSTLVLPASSPVLATVTYQPLKGDWQALGPSVVQRPAGPPGTGVLGAIAIYNPNPKIMYVGAGGLAVYAPQPQSGVYKTTDGGTTWAAVDNGLSDTSVQALHVDQSNPDIVLCGTYGAGIFRSTDGGATWSLVSSLAPVDSFLDFKGSIYAGTASGIAASADDGATWTIIEKTTAPVGPLSAAGDAVYAGLGLAPGCYGGVNVPCAPEPGAGEILTRATESGGWSMSDPPNATTQPPDYIAHHVAPNLLNPDNLFAADPTGDSNPDLYVSNDGASTWSVVPVPSSTCNYDVRSVATSPSTGDAYVGCDPGAAVSSDDGKSWSAIAGESWDTRFLIPDALGVAGNLLVGADQGLFLLPAGSTQWQSESGNIGDILVTGFDANGATIIVTAQDWAPIISFDAGHSWAVASGGFEIGMALINPGQPNDIYLLTGAGFQASFDGGHTFTAASPNSPPAASDQLVAVDPGNPAVVYRSTTGPVMMSSDYGKTWVATSWPVTDAGAIAVDPNNSGNIYVSPANSGISAPNTLLASKDGGATWHTWQAAGCALATIAIDPGNSNNVAIGDNCGDNYVSADGGMTFTAAARTPDGVQYCQMPATRRLRYDPLGSGVLAVASTTGLYLSSDAGAHWTNIRGNMIPMAVNEFQWTSGALLAGTCGEGVMQLLN